MTLSQSEYEAIIADDAKVITKDIVWTRAIASKFQGQILLEIGV